MDILLDTVLSVIHAKPGVEVGLLGESESAWVLKEVLYEVMIF